MSFSTNAGFREEGAFTPDALIAGDFPIRTVKATIPLGNNLARGALLGRIAASGAYILSLAAASDGSEVPVAILAQDVDATSVAAEGIAYISGDFNERAIAFGAGHNANSTRDGLRALSIYLTSAVSA